MAAALLTALTGTRPAGADVQREKRRAAIHSVREFGQTLSPEKKVGVAITSAGVLSTLALFAAGLCTKSERLHLRLLLGQVSTSVITLLGVTTLGLARDQYGLVTRNTLLETEREFRWFMTLPEERQLDYLESHPDFDRLFTEIGQPRAPSPGPVQEIQR